MQGQNKKEATEWEELVKDIPKDSFWKAQKLMRYANGTPLTSERLGYMEDCAQYIEDMAAPDQVEFDYQRCDPTHGHPPYYILTRVSINDSQKEDVETAMALDQPLPSGSVVVQRAWYYAFYAKSGNQKDVWRRPGGYVFMPGSTFSLGWCPPGIIEIPPLFDMTVKTLNQLMNIREYKRQHKDFDTNRSLWECDKEVPKTKNYPKKRSIVSREAEGIDSTPPIGGRDILVRSCRNRAKSLEDSYQGPTPRPPPSKKKRGKQGDGTVLTTQIKKMVAFGRVCWKIYGRGKDYQNAKDYRDVVLAIKSVPSRSIHSASKGSRSGRGPDSHGGGDDYLNNAMSQWQSAGKSVKDLVDLMNQELSRNSTN